MTRFAPWIGLVSLLLVGCSDSRTVGQSEEAYSLIPEQWHLENTGQSAGTTNPGTPGEDLNVTPVWSSGVTGAGVNVAVVDTGVQYYHYDLMANISYANSATYKNGTVYTNDPTPITEQLQLDSATYAHGTACAGIIAAVGDNGVGISGVAPDATLFGLNVFADGLFEDQLNNAAPSNSIQSFADALYSTSRAVHVSSNSWNGSTIRIYRMEEDDPDFAAVITGAQNGRNGKGIVYVFAAGNTRSYTYSAPGYTLWTYSHNANWHRELNTPYTITVAALNANGTYSTYSNFGANILVSGFGGEYGTASSSNRPAIVTTDLFDELGMDDPANSTHFDVPGNETGDFTALMNGTSAAAPMVAGVAALILEANPELSYRDVKYILATTARKNDPSDANWAQNGAGHWFNKNYGFGAVDSYSAVQKATAFTPLGTEVTHTYSDPDVNTSLANASDTSFPITVPLADKTSLEFVELTIDLYASRPGDMIISLISPSGTESELSHFNTADLNPGAGIYSINSDTDFFAPFTFGSNQFLDEDSNGTWYLRIRDEGTIDSSGTLYSYTLKTYGR